MRTFVIAVCTIFILDALVKSLTATKGIPVTLSVKSQVIDIVADVAFAVIGIHLLM